VNNGYFNWTDSGTIANHLHNIKRDLDNKHSIDSLKAEWDQAGKPTKFSNNHWIKYKNLLRWMFEYSIKYDSFKLFSLVEESVVGNPVGINYKGYFVTQDLCNSILDVNFILENTELNTNRPLRVMELGAGYGRIAYTLLKAYTNLQIVIVDIPPALYVSQSYLTSTFPGLKSFKFKEFLTYDEIRTDFESSSICFLTPEQIELIPNKSIDLFINISSLHEMTHAQINNWFNQINRVTNGWFYTKQFKKYPNLIDNLIIREEDYPSHSDWEEKVRRTNPIFQEFFEVVYKI
jgi:putative sugar O-methyltransferase